MNRDETAKSGYHIDFLCVLLFFLVNYLILGIAKRGSGYRNNEAKYEWNFGYEHMIHNRKVSIL